MLVGAPGFNPAQGNSQPQIPPQPNQESQPSTEQEGLELDKGSTTVDLTEGEGATRRPKAVDEGEEEDESPHQQAADKQGGNQQMVGKKRRPRMRRRGRQPQVRSVWRRALQASSGAAGSESEDSLDFDDENEEVEVPIVPEEGDVDVEVLQGLPPKLQQEYLSES